MGDKGGLADYLAEDEVDCIRLARPVSTDLDEFRALLGAGPNGLIAGAYLARAGLRVAVCERRFEAGGGLATEEMKSFAVAANASCAGARCR